MHFAWGSQIGDKQIPGPMFTQTSDAIWFHWAPIDILRHRQNDRYCKYHEWSNIIIITTNWFCNLIVVIVMVVIVLLLSSLSLVLMLLFSCTLSREYRVVRNRYSRLLFTSEDRLCANLRVREQSMNTTSQCQCLAFAWRHRSTVMTSQCQVRKDHPWRQWRNGQWLFVAERYVQDIK